LTQWGPGLIRSTAPVPTPETTMAQKRQDKRYDETIQRLTDKISEAHVFRDEGIARMVGDILVDFGTLRGELTPTQIGNWWYLVWDEADAPLLLADPST